jgi:hypothetical protein
MAEAQIQVMGPLNSEPASPLPWGEYTDDERDGILALVRDTLTDLLADVEAWVPDSMRVIADEGFELRISWQLASVDARVLRIRADAAAEEQRKIEELRRELGGD